MDDRKDGQEGPERIAGMSRAELRDRFLSELRATEDQPVAEDYPSDVPFQWSDDADLPEGAHPSFHMDDDPDAVEQSWRRVWLPTLSGSDPSPNPIVLLERIKAELHDYLHLVTEARKVYRHVTGGMVDRLDVSGESVVALADHRVAQLLARARSKREGGPHETGTAGLGGSPPLGGAGREVGVRTSLDPPDGRGPAGEGGAASEAP